MLDINLFLLSKMLFSSITNVGLIAMNILIARLGLIAIKSLSL